MTARHIATETRLRRARLPLLALIIAMAATLVIAARASEKPAPPIPELRRDLHITAPETVPAGTSFAVSVSQALPGRVDLIIEGAYGPRRFTASSTNGVARFTVGERRQRRVVWF